MRNLAATGMDRGDEFFHADDEMIVGAENADFTGGDYNTGESFERWCRGEMGRGGESGEWP